MNAYVLQPPLWGSVVTWDQVLWMGSTCWPGLQTARFLGQGQALWRCHHTLTVCLRTFECTVSVCKLISYVCMCVWVWKLISPVWALAATPRYRWGYCGFSTWSYRPSHSDVCLCGWGDNDTTRILFASFPSGHFPSHLAHFDPSMFKAALSRQEVGEWTYAGWP